MTADDIIKNESVAYRDMLDARNVRTPCSKCSGYGWRRHSSSSWRCGMGCSGPDVCNYCLGSGDEHRHGIDLRATDSEKESSVHAEAAELLAKAYRVELDEFIASELDRISRKRTTTLEIDALCRALARTLRRMLGAVDAGKGGAK